MALRQCDACGSSYTAKRANSRFCSDTCRKRGQRGQTVSKKPVVADDSGLVQAVIDELTEAGRLETVRGQLAVTLARQITSAAMASAPISKELRDVMNEATAGVKKQASRLDELKERRDRKHVG